MIITDPPYNRTECTWDVRIDLGKLFYEFNRIIKVNGVILVFGTQPFTSKVILANEPAFQYNWIWKKFKSPNFMQAPHRPLNNYEDISTFFTGNPIYHPIKKQRTSRRVEEMKRLDSPLIRKNTSITSCKLSENQKKPLFIDCSNLDSDWKYPELIIDDIHPVVSTSKERNGHPTQKPVAIYEYFIQTYTDQNMVVLDCFAGSNTIAEACLNMKRKFIAIELDYKYIQMGLNRIKSYFHNAIAIQKRTESFGVVYSFLKPIELVIQKEQQKKVNNHVT